MVFEILGCQAVWNGDGAGEAARLMPIEVVDGVMKALSVVSCGGVSWVGRL